VKSLHLNNLQAPRERTDLRDPRAQQATEEKLDLEGPKDLKDLQVVKE